MFADGVGVGAELELDLLPALRFQRPPLARLGCEPLLFCSLWLQFDWKVSSSYGVREAGLAVAFTEAFALFPACHWRSETDPCCLL